MQVSREDRVRMERAHVHAWPALRSAEIDGWLWRSSGGGSQRANSVSTIDFTGSDLTASIEAVEAHYRGSGMPARFQTFDETSPPGLADALLRRAYQDGEPTTTMFKPLRPVVVPAEVECRDHPWPEWLEVYTGEITASRRAVNRLILERVPPPRAFFGCRQDGRIIATALGVIGFGCAVIECVATHAPSRRQGAALGVLRALEAWAGTQATDLLGLQVVSTNVAAMTLYERSGFVAGAINRFWVRERG